jgi:prepilin-type N-terminal cleavage/methylation domain-containing protein
MPRGFTLMETMVVMAVLILVAGAVFPLYQKFEDDQVLKNAAWRTTSMIRQAESRAMTAAEDSAWGLFVSGSQATMFAGDSYAARDPSHDEVFTADSSVVFSGDSEVVFSKIDGTPSLPAATIFLATSSETITLNLNEKGLVEY